MALITCPECSKEVSDQASACPGCGYPIHSAASGEPEQVTVQLGFFDSAAGFMLSGEIVCPHCHKVGCVATRRAKAKKGISGAKATGALLTGGLSLLATGLSRKQWVTEAKCKSCHSTWEF